MSDAKDRAEHRKPASWVEMMREAGGPPVATAPALPAKPRYSFGSGTVADSTSLRIAEGRSFEEWREIGQRLLTMGDSSKWWLGDWLTYGRFRYGEKYRLLAEELELADQTLRVYAYVSGNLPLLIRINNLSWSHHREVAKLETADEQERWLARAWERGWSVRELREAIELEHPPSQGKLVEPSPLRLLLQERRPDIKAVADRHGEKVEQCVARLLGEALDRELLAVAA